MRKRNFNNDDPRTWDVLGKTEKLSFCVSDGNNAVCSRPFSATDLLSYSNNPNDQTITDILANYPAQTTSNPLYANPWQDPNWSIWDNPSLLKNKLADYDNYALGGPYWDCNNPEVRLGHSPGFMDLYGSETSGNHIMLNCNEVFDPNEKYYVVLHVNPKEIFKEERYDNNLTIIPVEINMPTTISESGITITGEDLATIGSPDLPVVNHDHHFPVWSINNRINGKVVIPNGYELTIQNCTIEFMTPNSGIIVERGGKLIVKNATLKGNDCLGNIWQGIEVHGADNPLFNVHPTNPNDFITGTYPYNEYYHGVVVLQNATIASTNTAITTKRTDEIGQFGSNPNYYGGIVYAENSTFRNNGRAVEFMKFEPDNISQFNNCLFEITTDNTLPINPWAHITMWETKGIKFNHCTFSFPATLLNGIDPTIRGIYSIDASYTISNQNTFNNCVSGVHATGTGLITPISIGLGEVYNPQTANIFNNNRYAIILSGTNKATVTNNLISLPVDVDCAGIYNDGALHSSILHNKIVRGNTANNYQNFGVVLTNTGNFEQPYEVKKNRFEYLTEGVGAQGINDGASILCNNNINVTDCIALHLNPNLGVPSIAALQGSEQKPAGNVFTLDCANSNNPALHLIADPMAMPYEYFHHTVAQYIPTCNEDAGNKITITPTNIPYSPDCMPDNYCPQPPCNEAYSSITAQLNTLNNQLAGLTPNTPAYIAKQAEIYETNRQRYQMRQVRVAYYVQQGNFAEALNSLTNETDAAAQQQRIAIWLQSNDTTAASAIANLPDTNTNQQVYKQFNTLTYTLQTTGNHWLTADSVQNATIAQLAAEPVQAGSYAKAAYQFINKTFIYPVLPNQTDTAGKTLPKLRTALANGNQFLYPNPLKNGSSIAIVLPAGSSAAQFSLYNVLGQVVWQQTIKSSISQLAIPANIANGVYFARITNTQTDLKQRYIIAR
ncbi:MAG: T9SS type A sorting domain-containing protein [Sphingobacteriales bacterium]|nr:T9SS type A sorting domain-containing protein [Sphingobacteriales bacterium]MBP9142118.1 T9SS type A sorting domain-containing protein [Chitinophagales bacterium]MDA0199898.1 T9SS type A sorting domain-containing protein [Bacteroidota bacterium]MBK6889663.1 T9SS type A sorting domain-containing protein [Sphingobacteriales bacterium]MBK7527824.1 T9SS type A sorting domain-containing protein [Sphingobacteriales bacterium]